MTSTELEVFSIFVWILIFGTVQICTVLNIKKDFRILADKLGKFNKNLWIFRIVWIFGILNLGYWEIQTSGYSDLSGYSELSGYSSGHWNIHKDIGKFKLLDIQTCLDIQICLDIRDFEPRDIGGGIWTLEYP